MVYTVHFVVRPRRGAACRIKAATLAAPATVDSEQLTVDSSRREGGGSAEAKMDFGMDMYCDQIRRVHCTFCR